MDQFLRTRILLGDDTIRRLNTSKVMLVGVGAVGSYCLEALVRAGIGNFMLIDHDTVDITNINRQIVALHSTIGKHKTIVGRDRAIDINPDVKITTKEIFIDASNSTEIVNEYKPDIVIDAIDSFDSKLHLIYTCLTTKQKIFSSMGAGRKTDPTQIKVADISKVTVCPLGKKIKKGLKDKKIYKGLSCVYSTEPAYKQPQQDVPKGTRQAIGSLPTVTGAFGLTLANQVIMEITNNL